MKVSWSGPLPPPRPRRPSAGPWLSHDTDEGEWVVDIPDDGEVTVTRLYFGDMETNTGRDISNADLVAAAPEMLETLQIHRTNSLTFADMLRLFAPDVALAMEQMAEDLRVVIAKATGEVRS